MNWFLAHSKNKKKVRYVEHSLKKDETGIHITCAEKKMHPIPTHYQANNIHILDNVNTYIVASVIFGHVPKRKVRYRNDRIMANSLVGNLMLKLLFVKLGVCVYMH